MRLILDLSSHCIETELKQQHNRAVSSYFHAVPEEKEQVEQIVELTQQALTALDFGKLRSDWPQLSGGAEVAAAIERCGETVQVLVDERPVASFPFIVDTQ